MGCANRCAPFALLALFACGAAESPTPETDPSSERILASGRVVGFTNDDGAHVWRGIPFAKPPVGALRWRAPLPPDPWEGVRDATSFGTMCPQFAGSLGDRDSEPDDATGSEDCLVANVFAPRFAPGEVPKDVGRRPVLVWIHGGGNSVGSAELYDMGRLAVSQDVIVVTVHYRLGAFGWFHHPALHGSDESPDDRSGNYGTLDLIRSLEWVRDNIAAFGGDPARVTVFGESAGGENVYSLLLSPRARGLFQRAISESGAISTSSITQAENFLDAAEPGDRHSSGEALLALLQRRGAADRDTAKQQLAALTRAEIESLLRGAEPGEILSVFYATGWGGMYQGPFLIRDGAVLPKAEPLAAFEGGDYNRVPAILGTNRDENKLFLLFTDDAVTRLFGVPIWLSDKRRYEVLAEYESRMWKVTGADEPAQAMSRWGDVFAYRFDWDEQPKVLFADFSKMLGAAHAMEIPFVMGRLDLGRANYFIFDEERRPAAQRLSDAMMSYWGEFAHRGEPGRGRAGEWPLWEPWDRAPEGPKFLVLDTEEGGGIRMSSEALTRETLIAQVERDTRFTSLRERCEVYASFVHWSLALSEDGYAEVAGGACSEFPLASFAP